jgi:hypothetical protein
MRVSNCPQRGSRALITPQLGHHGNTLAPPLTETDRANVASCVELSARNGVEVQYCTVLGGRRSYEERRLVCIYPTDGTEAARYTHVPAADPLRKRPSKEWPLDVQEDRGGSR